MHHVPTLLTHRGESMMASPACWFGTRGRRAGGLFQQGRGCRLRGMMQWAACLLAQLQRAARSTRSSKPPVGRLCCCARPRRRAGSGEMDPHSRVGVWQAGPGGVAVDLPTDALVHLDAYELIHNNIS